MAPMDSPPTRWNDDRLDEFASNVDRRFEQVERRFDHVDLQLAQVNSRVDGLHQTMVIGFIALGAMMFAGFGAMITLFATHF